MIKSGNETTQTHIEYRGYTIVKTRNPRKVAIMKDGMCKAHNSSIKRAKLNIDRAKALTV